MKAPLYTQAGKQNGDITLPEGLFGAEIKPDLMHLALVRQHANARISPAHVLRRGEVAGSTRKMYRQKGTGNARKGDRRASILRGGGASWGPRNDRNWEKLMPKKQRRAALASALSLKAKDGKILGLESFELPKPKTKEFTVVAKALPTHRSLLVIHNRNEALVKSARNMEHTKTLLVDLLNIHDLTKFDYVLFEKSAIEAAEKIFKVTKRAESTAAKPKKTTAKKATTKKTAGVV
ncbi:MAG: 50S ribosomal protein L4 [Candidatus Gracilibacteria bacterium]|nr:50S ribosomal protein L4 [Candidatus Gracilibacteria bacterium]MDD5178695.1 50S ribosomal protein L4 [Candidatus Gracilibacteria bacterium]